MHKKSNRCSFESSDGSEAHLETASEELFAFCPDEEFLPKNHLSRGTSLHMELSLGAHILNYYI